MAELNEHQMDVKLTVNKLLKEKESEKKLKSQMLYSKAKTDTGHEKGIMFQELDSSHFILS